jgi:hypothetical protein
MIDKWQATNQTRQAFDGGPSKQPSELTEFQETDEIPHLFQFTH